MKKDDIDTPSYAVDLDVLEHNIKDMAEYARGVGCKLRPMTKTHKCPAISQMQIAAGSTGIQTAKLGEAEVMEAAGIKDIFVSCEIIGEKKLERLRALSRGAQIRAGVDSVEGARGMSDFGERKGTRFDVMMDVDTGLGRSGVQFGGPAAMLASAISKMRGLNFIGIFTHEGSVYRASNREELERYSVEAAQKMVDTAREIEKEGIEVREVSMGSTPGAKLVNRVKGLTEIRPGAYVFNDVMQYLWYGVCGADELASAVLTTITSGASGNRMICDAGSKSAGPDSCGFGTFRPPKAPEGMGLIRTYGGEIWDDVVFDSTIGEEYGLFKLNGEHRPKIGEKYEIVPLHCCGTTNLFDEIYGIRDDEVERIWPVSGRGKFR